MSRRVSPRLSPRVSGGGAMATHDHLELWSWCAVPATVGGATMPRRFVGRVVHVGRTVTVAWVDQSYPPETYTKLPAGFEVLDGEPPTGPYLPYEKASVVLSKSYNTSNPEQAAKRLKRAATFERQRTAEECWRRVARRLTAACNQQKFHDFVVFMRPLRPIVCLVMDIDNAADYVGASVKSMVDVFPTVPLEAALDTRQALALHANTAVSNALKRDRKHQTIAVRRIFPALNRLMRAIGLMLQPFFGSNAHLTSMLVGLAGGDGTGVREIDEKPPDVHLSETVKLMWDTPVFKPILSFFVNLTSAASNSQTEHTLAGVLAILQNLGSPTATTPMITQLSRFVSTNKSHTQIDFLASYFSLCVSSGTMQRQKKIAIQKAEQKNPMPGVGDHDVASGKADNLGEAHRLALTGGMQKDIHRIETTTQLMQAMHVSNLPEPVQAWLKGRKDDGWAEVEMKNTGLETTGDWLASGEDDACLMALNIRFLEQCDRIVTPLIQSDEQFDQLYIRGKEARTIMGHTNAVFESFGDHRRQGTMTMKELQYDVKRKGENITKAYIMHSSSRQLSSSRVPNVWEKEALSVCPQLCMNYAYTRTLIEVIRLQKQWADGKHLIHGCDGQPMVQYYQFLRVIALERVSMASQGKGPPKAAGTHVLNDEDESVDGEEEELPELPLDEEEEQGGEEGDRGGLEESNGAERTPDAEHGDEDFPSKPRKPVVRNHKRLTEDDMVVVSENTTFALAFWHTMQNAAKIREYDMLAMAKEREEREAAAKARGSSRWDDQPPLAVASKTVMQYAENRRQEAVAQQAARPPPPPQPPLPLPSTPLPPSPHIATIDASPPSLPRQQPPEEMIPPPLSLPLSPPRDGRERVVLGHLGSGSRISRRAGAGGFNRLTAPLRGSYL